MTGILLAKAWLVWAAILLLAVANGALRELILVPRLGQFAGLLLSGALLSLLIVATAYLTLPWLGVRETAPLVVIGVLWLLLTVAFEFGFGLAQGKSWSLLLSAYTLRGGNVWPLVLLVTALAPLLAARLRQWI